MPDNILFLMTDQHSVSTIGAYGNQVVQTPALDRLAATGTRFADAFTPTAICTPARASLLTGAAPFRHKLLANYERNVGYLEDLADGQFTFASALGQAGWQLGLAGKWHGGVQRTAASYGFQGPTLNGWHNPVDHPDYLAYLERRGLPRYEITDKIRGVMPNGSDGRPFFLAAHFFGPHLPYIVPDEFFDMYEPGQIQLPPSVAETFEHKPPVQRNYSAHWAYDTLDEDTSRKLIAVYWGYVTLIDRELGRILDAAERLGLTDSTADRTAVMMTADHGEFTGAHRLHDKGPAMYDEIYRIPALVRVPGAPAGQVRDEFVTLMDFTATILDLAGLPTDGAVDGRSLLPLVRAEPPPQPPWRQTMLAEFHGHHFPYPQRMLRTRTHKLVVNPESCNELYDLVLDPDELVNRIADPDYAGVRRELLAELYRQLRDRGDNFYHWMTSMFEVGGVDYDVTLSSFESRAR
jgi:arylsulfatase A-like enzyme